MYLQTKTDMFAAAASHAGISNVTSYWGEGYWGYSYNSVAAADSYPWNNPDLFTKHGALFNADKINTPLLLLHGTVDTNVPIGESIQLYNALKTILYLIMQNVNCGTIQSWLGLPVGCRIVRHGGMTFIQKDIGDVLINN